VSLWFGIGSCPDDLGKLGSLKNGWSGYAGSEFPGHLARRAPGALLALSLRGE